MTIAEAFPVCVPWLPPVTELVLAGTMAAILVAVSAKRSHKAIGKLCQA